MTRAKLSRRPRVSRPGQFSRRLVLVIHPKKQKHSIAVKISDIYFFLSQVKEYYEPGRQTSTPSGMSGRSSWNSRTSGYFSRRYLGSAQHQPSLSRSLTLALEGVDLRKERINSINNWFRPVLIDDKQGFWADGLGRCERACAVLRYS